MTNQLEFEKEELTIGGDNFDFSTLSRYTQLKELYCYNCPLLTCLPELPATLTQLRCSSCPLLTCLPELPDRLTYLNCRDCPLLTCLPELPTSLTLLLCYKCPITELPELPDTLTELYCEKCPITELPELLASLTKLVCSQEYFIDKYDYHIDSSSIEKYRNDPKTIERRERNGMFNIVFK